MEQNDIYNRFTGKANDELAKLDVEIITPATEKMIKKHTKKDYALITENPEFYEKVGEH